MHAMNSTIPMTVKMDFRRVHKTLTRCGHNTDAALCIVIVTKIQGDVTPVMYNRKIPILHAAVLIVK